MIRRTLTALVLVCLPLSAMAQDRQLLGFGRLFDNDAIGDGHDRWKSGSYTVSVLNGPSWGGSLPEQFGSLLEYRFSGAIVSPDEIDKPAANDRRYAGLLSLGVHTYMDLRGIETSLGADLVAVGPATGVGRFQHWVHSAVGGELPDLSNQLPNALRPTVSAELGRNFALSDQISVRPFVAAEAGIETYVRAGGDITIGSFGKGGLMLRDDTTGQRYRAIEGDTVPAMSFTLGGDVAHVFNSDLLPSGGAAVASDSRTRLRAGVAWQGQTSSVFYGLTYLGPEFNSQPAGQVVGSLNINLRF